MVIVMQDSERRLRAYIWADGSYRVQDLATGQMMDHGSLPVPVEPEQAAAYRSSRLATRVTQLDVIQTFHGLGWAFTDPVHWMEAQ